MATFANFNICSTICNASWRKRETASADLLDTTEGARYCTVGYQRQRRTEAAHLLDEPEVIFSSNRVIQHQSLQGNTPPQLLRFVPRRFPWWRTFLQHQSQVCSIRSTGPLRSTSELRTRDLDCQMTRFCSRVERWFGRFFCEVYFAVSLSCSPCAFERIP